METQIRLLSTRKLTDHQKQLLLSANFSVDVADFIHVVSKPFHLQSINDYLIFTSQNAVESILQNEKAMELKTKKCFCVGEKTKAMLETNGFQVIASADYASELASIICNQYDKSSFTFFCGNLFRQRLKPTLLPMQMLTTHKQFR